MCIKLVKYWDKYTKMHGQQNVKILGYFRNQIFRVNDSYAEWQSAKSSIVTETIIACSHSDTGDTYKHMPSLVLDAAQRRLAVVLPTFRHYISAPYSRVKQSK